jgi:hypothetical protein
MLQIIKDSGSEGATILEYIFSHILRQIIGIENIVHQDITNTTLYGGGQYTAVWLIT